MTPLELTPEQHAAIYVHDKNLIVSAGAGSGKTFVLVERYLALLDNHHDWQLNALVAITFTQKAAQEMRDRVRQTLEQRLAASVEADSVVWASRLSQMDSARIDTIHALCASILRANAAEAGVDPDFAVLDETDAGILLDNVLDDTLRLLVMENDPVVGLFAEYDSTGIRDAVKKLVGHALPDLPTDVFAEWEARWWQDAEDWINRLLVHPDFVEAVNWQPRGGFPMGDDKIAQVWADCLHWVSTLVYADTFDAQFDALRQLRGSINLQGGKPTLWGGKEALQEAKDVLKIIRAVVDDTLAAIGAPPGEEDRRAALLLPLWVTLARRVQAAYRQAKRDGSLLDFDDLEAQTRALLRDFPHVRARYRAAEFKHLLVDEFQDTNAAQWDIVQALADVATPGTLFVVGDVKQSIYAFRGADVSVFEQVGEQIRGVGGEQLALALSFRSHEALARCFNALFERLLVRDESSPVSAYEVMLDAPMQAKRTAAPNDAPVLELLLLDKDTPDENGEKLDSTAQRRREAHALAARLRDMVEAERRLIYDKKQRAVRPMGYGDAALLFQSTTHLTIYEDALKALGLPYVTIAGRGYFNRQEVWDVLNLLHALYNPADNLALASALRSPLFNLSDDALLALRLLYDENGALLPLWDALETAVREDVMGISADERPLIAFAYACLRDLRELAGRVTIAELLRAALDRTGYLATLTALPDGDRLRGNVEKLLDKAQTSGKVTLGAFSQYLDDLTAREAREGEAALEAEGAIRLMTVHKSKGLEFPVVALVDASWDWLRGAHDGGALVYDPQVGWACKILGDDNKTIAPFAYRRAAMLDQQRGEAERKRLLYVAATRAQDTLLVSGQVTWKDASGWTSAGWLDWLLEHFDLRDLEPQPESIVERDWGRLTVRFAAPQAAESIDRAEDAVSTWDDVRVQTGQPLPVSADTLLSPLLRQVTVERTASARSLTATQIADLGSYVYGEADYRMIYRQRFRRSVLHDAPSPIKRVRKQEKRQHAAEIGEMVHQALRWWRFPTHADNLESVLQSYAWEHGIVDVEMRAKAVGRARVLLYQFRRSALYTEIDTARRVYRELPFIYQAGERTVRGVIDVLMERADGSWAIVDYKTSFVSTSGDAQLFVEHAQRFHLQVGVYAAAIRAQLGGVVPTVFIHYIRHTQTVHVPTEAWEMALSRMEDQLGDLLG